MSKQAVVLREAGGLGDILQLGSTCDLLKKSGHNVSLHTLNDPAILTLAEGLQGIDWPLGLPLSIVQRRPRNVTRYSDYSYLHSAIEQVRMADKFVDAWCPAVAHEIRSVRVGGKPTMSRAQAFAAAAGFDPKDVRPAEINKSKLMAGNGGFADTIRGRLGDDWILVHLKAKELARSVPDGVANALIYLLAERWTVVVFAYPQDQWGTMTDMDNVHWFTASRGTTASIRAVHAAFALAQQARLVIAVDSFMLHVSQAVGTPALLLTGPTDPVPLTAHYDKVHWVEKDLKKATCNACYYQAANGFGRSCREQGCHHLTKFSMTKLIAKAEEVLG